MFDELSSRFEDAVKGLRGEAKISENNINDALKEVKRALLDADVSLSVVKEFITDVKDKAIGEEVVRGCLLYTSPSPRDISGSRMPSSA